MGLRKWYEGSCDYCGSTEHWALRETFKSAGWIFSRYGVFCCEECKKKFIKQIKNKKKQC